MVVDTEMCLATRAFHSFVYLDNRQVEWFHHQLNKQVKDIYFINSLSKQKAKTVICTER